MGSRLGRRLAGAVGLVLGAAPTGCAGEGDDPQGDATARAGDRATAPVAPSESAPAEPKTPEAFLARAREAMAAEKGWTFDVKGTEALTGAGQTNDASYTATVRRTGEPEALHSTGTIVTKDKRTPLEVFVVGATAHVREGGPGAVWEKGPVSAPKFASQVEDAVSALKSFEEYAQDEGGVRVVEADGEIRLQARIPSGYLADRTQKPAVEKAGREIDPIVAQLRKRGAPASADRIALRDLEEDMVLDADTFRIKSHRLAFRFVIPYQGQRMTYSKEVREGIRGAFAGVIELPAGA